jgi:hypothetical protein
VSSTNEETSPSHLDEGWCKSPLLSPGVVFDSCTDNGVSICEQIPCGYLNLIEMTRNGEIIKGMLDYRFETEISSSKKKGTNRGTHASSRLSKAALPMVTVSFVYPYLLMGVRHVSDPKSDKVRGGVYRLRLPIAVGHSFRIHA